MNVASTFSTLRLCGLMLGAAALLFGGLARAGDPHDVARFLAGKSMLIWQPPRLPIPLTTLCR